MIHKQALNVLSNSTDGWISESIGKVNSNGIHARVMQSTESRLHVHENSDEFFLLLEGTLEIYVDGTTYQLEKGDTITVLAGQEHRARAKGRVELITVIAEQE